MCVACVCIYNVHVHVHVGVCVLLHMYMYMYMCLHAYVRAHTCTCIHVCGVYIVCRHCVCVVGEGTEQGPANRETEKDSRDLPEGQRVQR